MERLGEVLVRFWEDFGKVLECFLMGFGMIVWEGSLGWFRKVLGGFWEGFGKVLEGVSNDF